ncbi:conserved hypothetical protein [uncultured delta proteobacterium]|uniref:Uncharacterized protein n=1 Tax=uncultured delta proteobacterium TaxID=34034 RepID=A0A212KFK2_9DELT|nr:conserved hypothetical protein [uncultured delta proteobacterium]
MKNETDGPGEDKNAPDPIAPRCPICKQETRHVFTSKHGREIFQCQRAACGHFFTPARDEAQGVCVRSEDLERESDEALARYQERNIRLLELFLKYTGGVKEKMAILDFGAGNAHIPRTFKRVLGDKCTLYCLEKNNECKGLYEKYGLARIERLEDLPEKVDLIYLIEVIEHLPDPIATLRTFPALLQKGGTVFLSTPEGHMDASCTNAYDTPSHLHFFTGRSLNIALRAAGFTALDYKFYSEMYPRAGNNAIPRPPRVRHPGMDSPSGHLVGPTWPRERGA